MPQDWVNELKGEKPVSKQAPVKKADWADELREPSVKKKEVSPYELGGSTAAAGGSETQMLAGEKGEAQGISNLAPQEYWRTPVKITADQIDPKNQRALLNRTAYNYSAKKDYQKSNEIIAQGLTADPEDPYLNRLAYFNAKKQNDPNLRTLLDRAAQTNPDDPVILHDLSVFAFNEGKKEDAYAFAEKALTKVNPTTPEGKRASSALFGILATVEGQEGGDPTPFIEKKVELDDKIKEENDKWYNNPSPVNYMLSRGVSTSPIGMAIRSGLPDGSVNEEFDPYKNYTPSTAEDIGAEVVSLLVSMPLFAVGGGAANVVSKPIISRAVTAVMNKAAQKAIQRGLSKEATSLMMNQVANGSLKAITGLAANMSEQAGALSVFDATRDVLSQVVDEGKDWDDINYAQTLKRFGEGAALGMGVGAVGYGTNALVSAANSALTKGAAKAGGFVAENAVFVGGGAMLEGKPLNEITAKDWATSFATLGLLKGIGILKKSVNFTKEKANTGEFETTFTPEEQRAVGGKTVEEIVKPTTEVAPKTEIKLAGIDDAVLKFNQERLGMPDRPKVEISEVGETVLEKLLKKEPVLNEDLAKFSDELYGQYRALNAMKKADTRQFTIDQIENTQAGLEDMITKLETAKNAQAETGEFTTKLSAILEDPNVPTSAKAKLVWSSEGVRPDGIPAPESVEVKDNTVKTFDKGGNLLEVKDFEDNAEAEGEAMRAQSIINDRKADEKAASLTPEERVKVLDEVKGSGIDINTIRDAKDTTPEERRPEGVQALKKFNDTVDAVKEESVKKGGENAIIEGELTKNGEQEYKEVNARGPAAEAGDSNRPTVGREVTATEEGAPEKAVTETPPEEPGAPSSEEIFAKHIDERRDQLIAALQERGIVAKKSGSVSQTEFGDSGYMFVFRPNGELLKLRVSDHGVENPERMKNEIHNRIQDKDITNTIEQVERAIYPERYKETPSQYVTRRELEVPSEQVLPNDKIVPRRTAPSGKELVSVIRETSREVPAYERVEPFTPTEAKPAETTPEKPAVFGETAEEKERGTYQTIQGSALEPEVKEAMTADRQARLYKVQNIKMAQSDAQQYIKEAGLDQTIKDAENPSIDMPDNNRAYLLAECLNQTNALAKQAKASGDDVAAAGYFEQSNRLAAEFAQNNTVHGQAVNSTRILYDPDLRVYNYQKGRNESIKKNLARNKDKVDAQREDIKKIVAEAVDEALKKAGVKGAIEKTEKKQRVSAEKKAKDLAAKFRSYKIDETLLEQKKATAGFSNNALWNTMLEKIAVGIETGGKVAQIIEDALKMVHDSEWYKKLTDKEKKDTDTYLNTFLTDQFGTKVTPAEKLAGRIVNKLASPAKGYDPTQEMLSTLFGKATADLAQKETTQTSAIEKIKNAIANKIQYAQTWEVAKDVVRAKIEKMEIPDSEKASYLKELESFYEEIIGKPYSEKQVERATREGIKELGLSVSDVIKKHYTVYDASKQKLVDKLVNDAGVEGEDAKLLADAVEKEFNQIATDRIQKAVRSKYYRSTIERKAPKKSWDDLIEMVNMGAFSDSEFSDWYSRKRGWVPFSPEELSEMHDLVEKVQLAKEGAPRQNAVEELMRYERRMKGISWGDVGMHVFYSNILSALPTHVKNVLAVFQNTAGEMLVTAIDNPKAAPYLIRGTLNGYNRGIYEALHTLETGYAPVKLGKIDIPSAGESIQFTDSKRFKKFTADNKRLAMNLVLRSLKAEDMFTYSGAKEMRAIDLAVQEMKGEKITWKKIQDHLFNTEERLAEATEQAKEEGLQGKEFKRRVYELMEASRPSAMVEDASQFASRTTLNYPTEGTMGIITDYIKSITEDVKIAGVKPGKFIVPFTQIISNAANLALDWHPYGFVRAAKGGVGWEGAPKQRTYTPEQRRREFIKAAIGTIGMATLYSLSQLKDENGNRFIEITAGGYADPTKNYELKETGWMPYAIKIGNRWISYQYSPFSLIFAPIGILNDMEDYGGKSISDQGWLKTAEVLSINSVRFFMDLSFLGNLNDFVNRLTSSTPESTANWFTKFVANTAKAVAVPNMYNFTAKMIENIAEIPMRNGEDFYSTIIKDIPVLRDNVPIAYNSLGEPVVPQTDWFTSKEEFHPVYTPLSKVGITIGAPARKNIILEYPERREATPEEYEKFIKISGTMIKYGMQKEVIPFIGKIPKDALKKKAGDVKEKARKAAKGIVWGGLPVKMK